MDSTNSALSAGAPADSAPSAGADDSANKVYSADFKNTADIRKCIDSFPSAPFIDSHFHLREMEAKGLDPTKVLNSAVSVGVFLGMDIATNCENINMRRELLLNARAKSEGVAQGGGESVIAETAGEAGGARNAGGPPQRVFGYTIGLYPSFAAEGDIDRHLRQLEEELEKRREDPLLWALGEIGMDFHWNYGSPKAQEYLFRRQIELAQKYSLPIVVHNREADSYIAQVLADYQSHQQSESGRQATESGGEGKHQNKASTESNSRPLGIMHCFSSDIRWMETFLERGMYISLAGNCTFKNAQVIQEVAAQVPRGRLLLETDAPYLAPVPLRGRTNQPKYMPYIYQYIAQIRRIDVEELKAEILENFTRVLLPQ